MQGHISTIATPRDYAFVCRGHGSLCSSSSMLQKCRSPACPSNGQYFEKRAAVYLCTQCWQASFAPGLCTNTKCKHYKRTSMLACVPCASCEQAILRSDSPHGCSSCTKVMDAMMKPESSVAILPCSDLRPGEHRWPPYIEYRIPPSPTRLTWAGRRMLWGDVQFNGRATNCIEVQPEQRLTIELAYQASWQWNTNDYCPGCVVQLYYGLMGDFSKGIIEHGISTHWGESNFSFSAPREPGAYYITQRISLEFSYNYSDPHSNDYSDAFALVIVRPSSWTPENHRFFSPQVKQEIMILLLMAQLQQPQQCCPSEQFDEEEEEDDEEAPSRNHSRLMVPLHPETELWRLPKEVLFHIFAYIASDRERYEPQQPPSSSFPPPASFEGSSSSS